MVALATLTTPSTALAADAYLCKRTDYGCVAGSGYTGQSVWGSWGPGHNCVSYAAYRLQGNGAGKPWGGAIGNANQWDEKARAAGVPVDGTPAVGSIAQWDSGSAGHVAYVEAVTATYIEISEDSYLSDTSGYSSTRRLDRGGATFAAAEFIHVRDQQTPPQTPPGPGDADADGIADNQDRCPAVWGPSTNAGCPFDDHSLVGDFTGDGLSDVLAFYNYGNDDLGAWLFVGNGTGVDRERRLWSTGPGQWNWNRSHFVAGDYNADGRLDVLAFYDYGNDNLGAWLFPGTGDGVGREQHLWSTGNGMWNWSRSTFLGGDFNADGRADVLAFYDYGNDNLGAWLFPGAGAGVGREQHLWSTGNGMWNPQRGKYTAGDFNADGRQDVLAFYDYGNDNLGAWLFPGGGTGVGREQFQWSTGNGMWNWSRSTFLGGDFNADGRADVLAFYDYGSDDLGAWVFPGAGGSVGREQRLWTTGSGMWNTSSSRFLAGRFTGDARPDVLAFYDYGNDNLGAWVFEGAGAGVVRERHLWSTGNGMWNWDNM
ncbi:FG-GAP-like repeat-containing protein [Longispora urticae]